MKNIILFNPLACNGQSAKTAEKLEGEKVDVTKITDWESFLKGLESEDRLVLCGGDGTLNHFINDTAQLELPAQVFYMPAGTGNDFAHDIGAESSEEPVEIGKYLKDLPTVTVKGKTSRFLNGVGYGIDGYCCEVGDRQKAESDKPVNYTAIAITGLLFHFKPCDATVRVDGKEMRFHKVWLAPTMNGRYYGGSMMPTPEQDRLDPKHQVSLLVWSGSGKIPTLAAFPSIFKGEHLKNEKMCRVFTGEKIEVSFDSPCALQIDGETVLGVTSYSVSAGVPARKPAACV